MLTGAAPIIVAGYFGWSLVKAIGFIILVAATSAQVALMVLYAKERG
jgi:hypothetical protein